jgi:hypothetical protein
MFVRISTIRAYAEGVFDVWYACTSCGFAGWARAKGEGHGTDVGLYVNASSQKAAVNANVSANHDAERLVHGCPCPRCGRHNPQIVAWAKAAASKAAFRRIVRLVSTVLAAAVAAVMIPAMVWASVQEPTAGDHPRWETLLIVPVILAVLVALPLAIWRGMKPYPPPWSVFDQRPASVEFLSDDPYRGAGPHDAPGR